MRRIYCTQEATPGVGGTFYQSVLQPEVIVQFCQTVPIERIRSVPIPPFLEIIGLGTVGLYVLDVQEKMYGEISGHCYSWIAWPLERRVCALDNRRLVCSDLQSVTSWHFGIQDWMDFEDEVDVLQTDSIGVALKRFDRRSPMETDTIVFLPLVPMDDRQE